MVAGTPSPEAPPPKFSRYRSVRRAQEQQAQLQQLINEQQQPKTTPPVPPLPAMEPQRAPTRAPTVSASMSRYHRRPTTSHAPAAQPPPSRSGSSEAPPTPGTQTVTSARNRALSSPQTTRVANGVQPRLPSSSRSRPEAAPLAALPTRQPTQTARDEAKQLMQDEAERYRRMKLKQKAEKQAKLEAEQAEHDRQEKLRKEEEELARLVAQREAEEAEQLRRQREEQERGKRLQKVESAKRQQQREEAERRAKVEEAARKAQASPPVSPPRQGGGFGLFRRRKDGSPESPESPRNAGRPRQTSNGNRDMDTIRPGGGGAVLGIDAPISAVNAGDRHVTVVRNKKYFVLPVTPETTAQDLLRSASTCMSEPIDLRTDVLVENFQKVSVKRPLRNYEHVRDVMNSWDADTQNDLEIVNAAYHGFDRLALLADQVPPSKPQGMGCYIHYSSRPGKWNKRYVTLRTDGQLVMAKSETAKDQDNVCHMSDFDIYTPTDRKLAKVKPPKKHCYAVKSQQKSNIFSDESRYVHFFCTNDRNTASTFYNSMQGWRSWHLKHVMGEGQKKLKPQEPKATNGFLSLGNGLGTQETAGGSSHNRNASDNSFYQLGTFKPLMDLDQFGKSLDEIHKSAPVSGDAPLGRSNTRAMHARKMSTRVKGPPPVTFSRGALVDHATQPAERTNSLTHSSTAPEGDAFAPTSLLGRTYSQRQRAAQAREKKDSGPFTEGPSLVSNIDYMAQAAANDSGLGRKSSVRSNHRRTSSDIQRSASKRGMPKPLIDLTPQYQEPPQHARKGKGFALEPGSGPLVENATSLEEAIKVPSATDWRSRPATARPHHGTYGTGGHERTRSIKGRGEGLAAYTFNNHSGAPEDDSNAFTGGGLLARTGYSQGHTPVGHGIMDGSKARGPMLDMRENSQFASGSLLASVERKYGPSGPVIDRDKRRSVDLG